MAGFLVKNRKIVVDGDLFRYSIREGPEGRELLVYRDKKPVLRLALNWTEGWGIDLFRPKVVERVIRYYRPRPPGPEPRSLCREEELFSRLADLCFSPEEQAGKELFLQRCSKAGEDRPTTRSKGE